MRYLFILLQLITISSFAQHIKNLHPELGYSVDLSPEGERKFIELQKRCAKFWYRHKGEIDPNKLSVNDRAMFDECIGADIESYFDILGPGCSWYCGGGLDEQTASSSLKSSTRSYKADNIHDLSYKTAWIEGVPGYGIGEYVQYNFPPDNPRITKIIIVNGYVKSEKTWRENSRVKTLRMYLNDKPFAILNLKDSKQEQAFTFEPLGHADRSNLSKLPSWSIRFEIIEVYRGDKYDDTAITEIYFDGIDVH